MAGAIVLAARSSLSSGAGLVHALVHEQSRSAVQAGVTQALAHAYDDDFDTRTACDAVGIGPGLGRTESSWALLERHLEARNLPLVLDADALTMIAHEAHEQSLPAAALLAKHANERRPIVCTPHVGEFARLMSQDIPSALDARVELAQSFAITARCTILLKGTPTIVCSADGTPPLVVPRGSPALATGGSGDLLTGIITTMLAQRVDASKAAALGAWIQGRAAEIASMSCGTARGIGLDSVIESMCAAWREIEQPASFPMYVIAELPPVAHAPL